ncbi:MAG TPA: hypothetical protein EYP69_02935 [Bacteroidales bacterium]|nr:hypothetical protein [Bacteroidales bacterium]
MIQYNKFRVIIFSFLFSMFLIYGCSFSEVEIGNIEGIELLAINKSGVDFNLMIPITNKNKYAFTIKKIDLIINDKSGSQIATLISKKHIRLLPDSKKIYHLNFKLKFTSLKNVSIALIKTFLKRSANLKITGYIKVGKFIFSKKIPVDESRNYQFFRRKGTKIQFP